MLNREHFTTLVRDYIRAIGDVAVRHTMTVQEFEERYPKSRQFYTWPDSRYYKEHEKAHR